MTIEKVYIDVKKLSGKNIIIFGGDNDQLAI